MKNALPNDPLLKTFQKIADKRLPEMEDFLRGLVLISSETKNRAGVIDAGDFVAKKIPDRFQHEIFEHADYGNCHYFENKGDGSAPFALMGHIDTVIPKGFDCITKIGDHLQGPGIADMKGGITVMVYTLRILEEAGVLDRIPVRCLINTEEEVNSPWSRTLVPKLQGCRAGFVFEMGGLNHEIVIQRIGITIIEIKITGIAAHAGTGRGPKSSAILELAKRIDQLEALNTPDLLVNVGTIRGGKAYNYVPDEAEAKLAIRFWSQEEEERFLEKLHAMENAPLVKGCATKFKIVSRRPPLLPTKESKELYAFCASVAQSMEMPLPSEARPGGSDASFIQAQGVPTLDGWGPVGDYDFSPQEYIVTKTLSQRSALLAACLWKLHASSP